MAKTTKAINSFKKASKGAFGKFKNQEAKAKGSQMPGNVKMGVGKLVKAILDVSEASDRGPETPFFQWTILAVDCEANDEKKISNLKTTRTIWVRDNSKYNITTDGQIEKALNEFMLMHPTIEEAFNNAESEDDIPKILVEAVELEPIFYFNTTEMNDRVYSMVQGVVDPEEYDELGISDEAPQAQEEPEEEAETETPSDDTEYVGSKVTVNNPEEPDYGEWEGTITAVGEETFDVKDEEGDVYTEPFDCCTLT